MLCNQPVMTATCSVSSLRKSRRQRLSCSGECQRPTVKLLSGEPNMKLMPSSAPRSLKSPSMNITKADYCVHMEKGFHVKTDVYKLIVGRSWLSACRRQRNKLRLWTPNVLLWRRPNRDSRVRWRTSWLMWREPMLWLPTLTRSRGTLTR